MTAFQAGFDAGFRAGREDWNGEYPHYYDTDKAAATAQYLASTPPVFVIDAHTARYLYDIVITRGPDHACHRCVADPLPIHGATQPFVCVRHRLEDFLTGVPSWRGTGRA